MKKIVIALLAVVMILCSMGLVACDNASVLENYIFEYDGTVVTKDFVLPQTISGKEVKWSSDNEAVTLAKGEDSWTATINFPEEGQKTVTLTLSLGGSSKTFTVIVKALDVYSIADNYNFPQNKATITADFTLDSEASYKGKKATIEWSIAEDYSKYIALGTNDNGAKICKVTPQSEQTAVKIVAKFTYNGQSAEYPYDMTVYKDMEGYELVDYWYNNTGVSITMSGYVVEIGTAYSADYKNVNLYMVNDDFTAGYYLYRVGCDADNGALLEPGVHVTCTGTTNTNYNGLIETNAGGTLVVDKDVAPINVRDHVYAIDQDIIGDLPATVYNESRLVSLTNWNVKSIDATDDKLADGNFTLMTIEKGGKSVDVRVSKYLEGSYKSAVGDGTFDAIVALRDVYGTKGTDGKYTKKDGAVISVTGILSRYKDAWQIMPLAATDITAGTADTTATDDFVGTKVAAAIKKVNAALKDADLDGSKRITTTASATLPAAEGDVEISYRAVNAKAAVISGDSKNVLTVTPGNPEQSTLEITYKLGEFKTVQFVYIKSLIPTAVTMLDDIEAEMSKLVGDGINKVVVLPSAPAGATLTWSVRKGEKDGNTVIEIIDGQIVPTLYENEVKGMSITATLTYEGVTKTRTIFINVKAGKGSEAIDMSTVAEDTAYVLTIDQTNLSKQLYAMNEMNGYYGKTTEDFDSAASIYVQFVKDTDSKVVGYKLYFKKSNAKNYLRVVKSGDHTNFQIDGTDETASVFTYDATNKCLKTKVEDAEYYIGTYSTYNTVSASAISRISGSFPAYLGKETFKQLESREIEVETIDATTDLSTTEKDGKYTITAKDGQRITFTAAVDEGYTLTVTVNGKAVKPDDDGVYTVIVSGETKIVATGVAAPISIADFLAKETDDNKIFAIQGWVTAVNKVGGAGSFVIADSTGAVFSNATANVEYGKMYIVYGTRDVFNGVAQIGTTNVKAVETAETFTEPTATELAASTIDLSALETTIGTYTGKYYKITGTTAAKSGNYVNANYNGNQLLSLWMNDTLKAAASAMDGKEIVIYGYVRGFKANTYLTIQVAKVELADTTGGTTGGDSGEGEGSGSGSAGTDTPAGQVTVSKTISELKTANGWQDATIYASFALDTVISVASSCTNPNSYGQNTGKYYNNGTNWRIYQNENPSVVISAATGYKIVSVKVTYASQNTGVLTQGTTQVASGTVVTVNASSITFSVGNTGTATNGQARITAIEVIYAPVTAE